MVEPSAFRGVVEFMGNIGVYDIILPFLLVFTIVFAILEKTRILGTEKVGDQILPKKNLNTVIALCIPFFVIASIQIVSVISEVMANVSLILVLSICFLMMVGVFYKEGEFNFTAQHPTFTKIFVILSFIGLVIIFLNAMGWLKYISWIIQYWSADTGASVFFFAILIGFIIYITRDGESKPTEEKKK